MQRERERESAQMQNCLAFEFFLSPPFISNAKLFSVPLLISSDTLDVCPRMSPLVHKLLPNLSRKVFVLQIVSFQPKRVTCGCHNVRCSFEFIASNTWQN